MSIVMLKELKTNPTQEWGHNGYTTDRIFEVKLDYHVTGLQLTLQETIKPYRKNWHTTEEDITGINKIIAEGHSFGAYDKDDLIGWLITEYREWNNTLHLENLLISEWHRGKQIGAELIAFAVNHAREIGCRSVQLETQNTNYGAILFYQKVGFRITGIDTNLYNEQNGEVAVYMSYDLNTTG